MRTRDLSLRKVTQWAAPIALSTVLFGCPNQELAPITPCTVSGVSLEVPQSGVDKVDMLFMIDNSGSMGEEQKKLASVLPKLVAVLATGNKSGMPSPTGVKSEFPPVQSLHIGVVTSDMGIAGAPTISSCGAGSFIPTDKNPTTSQMRINKPVGDDGILQVDTSVAAMGIWVPPAGGGEPAEVVPADPSCANISFPPTARFVDFTVSAGGNAADAALRFSCIAKRGRNGCGLEQQLEAVLKALTPPDSAIKFTAQSPNGHGNAIKPGSPSGFNQNFLREDSILAIVVVSDEEDCSIPDNSRAIFDSMNTSINGGINVRCGLKENQGLLHPVDRFIQGISALKPAAYKDRLIFTAIAGIPLAPNTGKKVHSGAAALDTILARADMQFGVRPNGQGQDEPVPTCTSDSGDGNAAPGRRYLEVAKAFGDNGLVTSICEDEYGTLLDTLIDKIAAQLTGACLPRKLTPDPMTGKVDCDVVEIQAAGSTLGCDPAKGRVEKLPNRRVNNTERTVCRIDQVTPGDNKEGWFYDDKSKEVRDQCKKDPQRIAFTGNGNPPAGAQAKFECFQPVQSSATDQDTGRDAVNLNCAQNPLNTAAPFGDSLCNSRGGAAAALICIQDTCQIACERDSQCPAGWVCTQDVASQRLYCINPTCPASPQ